MCIRDRCCILFQLAIPIPIEDGELPVFEGIFTDIGDEQSIEQNLSTFSAHISNLVEFLPFVNQKPLCFWMSLAQELTLLKVPLLA